ncbi:hypothetical protein EDB84DRAFT_1509244 [Lactarius hengduanensis]|nr:hypothetical protein EDB84DRAFT_1509244 [Lactarius hengduanensis]
MYRSPESGGGDDALVLAELHVLDVHEAPNCTINTIGGTRKGALSLSISIGDIGGNMGAGVAPTQQAKDVAGLGLDVALYPGLVLYLGAARDHDSVTGHLEAITEPCSGCLRSDTHKITTAEIRKSELAEVEGLEVAVDEGHEELIERGTSGELESEDDYDCKGGDRSLGGLLENDAVTGGDLGWLAPTLDVAENDRLRVGTVVATSSGVLALRLTSMANWICQISC